MDTHVVLVTGAARGLGQEVARQLAALAYRVVITARDADRAGQAAAELGPNVSALPVGLDVSDPASVAAAAKALTASSGRLDVLVNNAAAYVDWTETATEANLDDAHQVMETNLFGAWRLTQALLPLLRQSPVPASSTSAAAQAPTTTRPSACGPAAARPPATASPKPRSTHSPAPWPPSSPTPRS